MSGFGQPRGRPTKSSAGVWAGNVTRVDGGRPFVEIPRYAAGHEWGPLQYLATADPWVVGDRVLVTFLEGRGDTPIVLGRLV